MTGCRPYRGKRLVDLALLAVAALPALALGALCALAIAVSSPGPVFFRQVRIGRDGVPFTIVKFRTMTPGDNPVFPDADRITAVGRVLRRLSLDELPQLFNVAGGTMSFVGPRPTLPYQVARYDARQRRRLCVRPGITGLAQVRGRNLLTWADRIELDLDYIDRQSAVLDLGLVAATVGAVFRRTGIEGHPTDDPIARPPEPDR